MRALVTGSEGFVGRVLAGYLADRGWEVRGCDTHVKDAGATRRHCDVCIKSEVEETLEWAGDVTHVFHLAGVTFVPLTIEDPALAMNVNANGTIHVAQAMLRRNKNARLVFVSTAEVYGPPQYLPIDEKHPLNPTNPYSIAKAAADSYCAFLSSRRELDTVRARPFNHTGAGQGDQFVLSSFAKQIVEIEAGKAELVLRVGNLGSARDFSHVNDVVRAYELLALHGRAGEAYNICSGTSRTIREAMEGLIRLSGKKIATEIDPKRFRNDAVPEICGTHHKLTKDTGWEPEIKFDQLLQELLNYWRGQLLG